jgi:hypothetical protein
VNNRSEPDPNVLPSVQEQILCDHRGRARRESNFYVRRQVVPKGTPLKLNLAKSGEYRVPKNSIVVFADDAPRANWSHPCRYLLHDAATGAPIATVPARLPPQASPALGEMEPFHQPVAFFEPPLLWRPPRPWPVLRRPVPGARYAILFSGMSNNRHTNDLEFLYRTLRDVYGVPDANIYVLNHDGTLNYDGNPRPITAWPGDNTAYRMTVHGQGSRTDFEAVIDELKTRIKPNDSLLIHTNNHGDHDGTESNLCTYPNWGAYGATDFAAKVGQLPRFRCLVVMMEQCRAGGFNAKILASSPAQNTSVASAAREENNSIGGAHFDPFARDWIAAMAGLDPYGATLDHDPDTNHDGRVSAKEAFQYADSIHDPYDTPVYSSSGASADGCHLGIRWYWELYPVLFREFLELIPVKLPPGPLPDPPPDWLKKLLVDLGRLEDEVRPKVERLQRDLAQRMAQRVQQAGDQAAGSRRLARRPK